MNCKPGDMAMIVPDQDCDRWASGFVVRCVELDRRYGAPCWLIEPEIAGPFGAVDGVEDCILRPIRADGISDEEVRDLYAPKVPEAA